jgi:hypothetical protein
MALIDDFKTRFPEFAGEIVDQFLPQLAPVWPCYFGGDYANECDREAILNLVAHLLVMETQTGSGAGVAGGVVTSKAVGSVSVSYAAPVNPTQVQAFFSGTKYGQRFLLLRTGARGGVFV